MNAPRRYTKRPIEIEAMRLDGDTHAVCLWMAAHGGTYLVTTHPTDSTQDVMYIDTLEGRHTAQPGDWIIRGIAGEFYPCKPDIFEATYEPKEQQQ